MPKRDYIRHTDTHPMRKIGSAFMHVIGTLISALHDGGDIEKRIEARKTEF